MLPNPAGDALRADRRARAGLSRPETLDWVSMGEPAKSERRKTPRIMRRLPVRFGTEAEMRGGTVIDISEGGLKVEAPEPFQVNALLHVFVQFPRNAIRLRARVVWVGGGSPTMGLAFMRPEPNLMRQYQNWVAEVKQAAKEDAGQSDSPRETAGGSEGGEHGAASPASGTAGARKTPKKAAEKPVKRRVETMHGSTFDVRLERDGGAWLLTIHRLPRQPGVEIPLEQQRFSDYASAERSMREFLKSH